MINNQLEFDALRSEMKCGFAYVNARLDSVDIQLTKHTKQIEELRTEMKAQGEELRSEMKAQGEELRAEIKAQGDEFRQQIKMECDEVRSEYKSTLNFAVDAIMAGMDRCYSDLRSDIIRLEGKIDKR